MKKEILFILIFLILVSCTQNSYQSGKAFEQESSFQRQEPIPAYQTRPSEPINEDLYAFRQTPSLETTTLSLTNPFSIQITDLTLPAIPQTKRTFTSTQNIEISDKNLFGLSITGSTTFLTDDDSLIRVILEDIQGNEYLVLETYNRLEETNTFTFDNFCQETCILDNIKPKLLKLQVENAILELSNINYLENKEQWPDKTKILEIEKYSIQLRAEQAEIIVNKLNKNLLKKDLHWRARVTPISLYSYAEKRKLLPNPEQKLEFLPSLKGFEHYGTGIFSLEPIKIEQTAFRTEDTAMQASYAETNLITGNVVNNNNPNNILFYSERGTGRWDFGSYTLYDCEISFEPFTDMEISTIKPDVSACNGECIFDAKIYDDQDNKLAEVNEKITTSFDYIDFPGVLNQKAILEKGKKYKIQLKVSGTKTVQIYTAGGETPKTLPNGAYDLINARGQHNANYLSRGPIAFSLIGEIVAQCYDSDKNTPPPDDYRYVSGYVEGYESAYNATKKKYYDYCGIAGTEKGKLIEYFCDAKDYVQKEIYDCPVSCRNGRCLSAQEVIGNLPKSFDWRTAHGENWITPVKSQYSCGSCWAFGAIGAVEAGINVFYNKKLDIDLSEADMVCNAASPLWGGCSGWFPSSALSRIKDKYVVTEDCLPYNSALRKGHDVGGCESPYVYCSDWRSNYWKIKGYHSVPDLDKNLKRHLLEKGPLSACIEGWNHCLVLVGYEEFMGDTVWIFKNSWLWDWGEKGFLRMILPASKLFLIYSIEEPYNPSKASVIACNDNDNDGYCNWGVSEIQPSTCSPSCKSEKDCDDSNPNVGPCDNTYESHFEFCDPDYKLSKIAVGQKDNYVVGSKNYEITFSDISIETQSIGKFIFNFTKLNILINGKKHSVFKSQEGGVLINLDDGGLFILKRAESQSITFMLLACRDEPVIQKMFILPEESNENVELQSFCVFCRTLDDLHEIEFLYVDKDTNEFVFNIDNQNYKISLFEPIRLNDGTLFLFFGSSGQPPEVVWFFLLH